MDLFLYCKVYGIDGIHFAKIEKGNFTLKWLRENFTKSKQKMEMRLAYDDLSGDRVLLSNEAEFKLMMDTMDGVGANMVKLYVTKTKKKPTEGKYSKSRELLRGGSFGIYNVERLRGFNKVGTSSDSNKTITKSLVNAYKVHLDMNQYIPLNVAEIRAKWDKDSVKVVFSGQIGYPDLNLVFDKQIIKQLENEPKKCAWIDSGKHDAYILNFETKKDAAEFFDKSSK